MPVPEETEDAGKKNIGVEGSYQFVIFFNTRKKQPDLKSKFLLSFKIQTT